jgi:hypothetical protein
MRALILAASLIALNPFVSAHAQNVPATAPDAKATYSTATTDIGTLLDDPAARAVLDKHVPQISHGDQIDLARSMTLRDLQQYSPDVLTDKVLAEVDADLANLPAKK